MRVSIPSLSQEFPDGRDEPSPPAHDRGHDRPQHVAGDATICRLALGVMARTGRELAIVHGPQPSKELAAVVGSEPLPRPEVVSKVWDYIKKNKLQNPTNKREIMADDKLRPVFGKDRVSMFEMDKH